MSERKIVLRGSIRVDARRARAKLREHLLVDLRTYPLELARAAVALGATAMNLTWDADDIRFAFDGPSLSAERLACLLDFALSDAEDEHAAPLRCLALGVNAALGLGVSFVAVTSTHGSAGIAVRFRSEALADESESSPPLRAVSCSIPDGAFAQGTQIHVRRKLGLGVLRNVVSRDVPPEVRLLIENTREAPLALFCAGVAVLRPLPLPTLLRVPFTLPGARRAAVEIGAAGGPARVELMERGVLLLSLDWVPLNGLSPTADTAVSARVVVDVDELPTNASRSALREDTPLARELWPAAESAFRKALAALVARASGAPHPDGVEVLLDDPRAWLDALGAALCTCVETLRAGGEPDPEVRALLDLPLFDTAGGGRISVAAVVSSPLVRVWKKSEPPPHELAPWLAQVVWLRGRVVERVLQGSNLEDASTLLKRAREGAARRARFLAHAASAPTVPSSPRELARERFSLTTGPTAGLTGELVLLTPLGVPGPSLLRVFVEGRMLEAVVVEPDLCPLSFDAAVAWPSGLRPRFDYDGVERDARLNQTLHAVSMLAVGIADRAAARLTQLSGREQSALERVLRDAIIAWSVVPARLGLLAPDPTEFSRDYAQLFGAETLATTAGGRVSLQTLASYAREKKALCVVPGPPGGPPRPAPDGRPVLVAAALEAEAIAAALPDRVTRIPYQRAVSSENALGAAEESSRVALARGVGEVRAEQGLAPRSAQLWLERDGAIVLVAPAIVAVDIESHVSVVLLRENREKALCALIVATDDPRTVPNADWTAPHWKGRRHRGWVEQRFVEKAVAALEGDDESRRALGMGPGQPVDDLGLSLCLLGHAISLRLRLSRAAENKAPDPKLSAMLARIEALPILQSLDASGSPSQTSVAEAASRHGEKLPLLDAAPGFSTGDWAPVLVRHERERELLLRRFPRATAAATELKARRARAKLELDQQAVLARPAVDIRDFGARIGARDVVAHLPAARNANSPNDLEVALALPPGELSLATAWVDLRFDGRPVHGLLAREVGLPIVANLSSHLPDDFVDFGAPTREGLGRIGARLQTASIALLRALAEQRQLLSDPRALALCLALCDFGSVEQLRTLFASESFRFPTVQGDEAPWSQLSLREGRMLCGTGRYSSWRSQDARASELDRPILFLPAGDAGAQISALFGRFGATLDDVSAALDALQQRRGGSSVAAPKLAGAPVHPALRKALWELGVGSGDGELELIAGADASVSVLLLDGRVETLMPVTLCAFRAVARVDAIDVAGVKERLVSELDDAAVKIVVSSARELDQLPAFVRRAARRVLCLRESMREEASLTAAPVFEGTAGTFHSLAALATENRWQFTSLAPPFPPMNGLTLRLTLNEAEALTSSFDLVNVDAQIERMRGAERRRTAPQVPTVLLSTEQRAACLVTTPVNVEGTTGEVGVLLPARAELAGGTLHVMRRPLSPLDPGDGWPLVMMLNDDSVEPDRYFEAPALRALLPVLSQRARLCARSELQRVFAPGHALASRWLDEVQIRGFRVTGALWLGARFPETPRVRVYAGQQAAPIVRSLEARIEKSAIGTALPLEGDLLVRWVGEPDGGSDAIAAELGSTLATLATLTYTWNALNALGEQVAVELLRELRAKGSNAPAADEHAISLALLGLDSSPPLVVAADGTPLDLAAVVSELQTTGTVWTSDGRGFADGSFPGALPKFFVTEGSALARVLALRAPAGGRSGTLRGCARRACHWRAPRCHRPRRCWCRPTPATRRPTIRGGAG